MSDKKQYIKWILSEIPRLAEQGIISTEGASHLEQNYRLKLSACAPTQKIFSLILCVIGIVMAAAGVVLFLNYNWDMFSKPLRITFAALPLAAGAIVSYFTILRGKGQLWKEVSAILTATGCGTLIAVLSQIYHIGGEFYEFMFLLLLLSLPLIYIFNSIGLASLYLFLTFGCFGWSAPLWWQPLLILLVMPYFFFHLRKSSPWHIWCRWLMPVAGIAFCINLEYYPFLSAITLCSIFLICGMDLLKEEGTFLKNPWLIPAFAVQTALLASGSSYDTVFFISSGKSAAEIWTFGVGSALLAVLFIRCFLKRRITIDRGMSLLLILLAALPLVCDGFCCRVIFNIYLGLAGIVYIRSGIKKGSLLVFNGGAIMVCVLTCCRFFDSDLGVLYRSGGLILLGLGFIIGNWFFIRCNREAAR